MDDQQILDTINGLYYVQARQQLRAQFQEEGRSEAFREALARALGQQAQKERREEVVMRPARWAAGTAGKLLGRAVRKLEEQAEQTDQERAQ